MKESLFAREEYLKRLSFMERWIKQHPNDYEAIGAQKILKEAFISEHRESVLAGMWKSVY